jgi:hypothetical protein
VAAPWVLKPRSEASAAGNIKVFDKKNLWMHITEMGNNRFKYLLEQFRLGDVFHCDSLILSAKILCSITPKYLSKPIEISQGGGIFRSANIEYVTDDDKAIKACKERVLELLGDCAERLVRDFATVTTPEKAKNLH